MVIRVAGGDGAPRLEAPEDLKQGRADAAGSIRAYVGRGA